VAHVELSLTETGPAREIAALHRWVHPVSAAAEASVLLDADGVVIAASAACAAFFAVEPADALGRRLVGEVLRLVDFSAASDELPEWESERIAPVLALTSGAPARGLLRAVGPAGTYMLDAVTTPLREDATVVGSLTFFATVSGQ
jgi:hypothetical protein